MREQPATDLTIATRILARSGALAPNGRITLRLHDVVYVAGKGASLATMTPYDVAVLFVEDASVLHGTAPDDVLGYLAAHRRWRDAASVARIVDGTFISAPTLRACSVAALRRARGEEGTNDERTIERVWEELVAQARISGALIGAFPTDEPG